MTRVFVVGDLHFSRTNMMIDRFIERVNEIMNVRKYDACVLLGDIFHTHEKIEENVLNMVIKLFYTITNHCHLYVIVGNHDYKDGQQFLTNRHALAAFAEWPHVTVIDQPKIVKFGKDASVTMCPFVPTGRFREALDKVDWKKTNMVFCHQEFEGAKMGSVISYEGDKWSTKYPQVVSGHIHEKQNLNNGVYYPGSPYDTSYGFSGKRVMTDIEFVKGEFKIQSIESGLPRKVTVRLNLDEAKEYKPDTDDFIRMVVLCRKEEYNEFLKTDHAKNLKKYAGVKIAHKTENDDEIADILRDKHLSKCETYRDTLEKLVQRESDNVKDLYKNILRQTRK